MKHTLITSAADIRKAIASIQNRGAKLDASIQEAGLSVLAHIAQHRDTTMADALVNAMPKGGRRLALVEWMLAFGTICKLDPKTDKAAIIAGRIFKNDDARKLDLEGGEKREWHEFRPEPALATAFDVQAAVLSVIARLHKAAQAGTVENKEAALREARALVAALGGDEGAGLADAAGK